MKKGEGIKKEGSIQHDEQGQLGTENECKVE